MTAVTSQRPSTQLKRNEALRLARLCQGAEPLNAHTVRESGRDLLRPARKRRSFEAGRRGKTYRRGQWT